MKSKLRIQLLVAIGCLVVSLAAATAQPVYGARPDTHPNIYGTSIDPNTGLPVNPATGTSAAPTLDPNTGLPVAVAEAQWIDPNWSDPGIVLTNVVYDGLPLVEVARQLRERFKDSFDILPMPQTFGTNWGDTIIQLQLNNVRASDVFNAMNMVFESDRTPLRWQLKANSSGRQMVQLRVIPQFMPEPGPSETHRMVCFVGNLIGDEKSGGMTMEQIVKTITDIWPGDLGKSDDVIQFHKEAQLLVVNGTPEQLEFVRQTLAGLQQRADWQRSNPKSGGLNELPKNDLKSNNTRAK